jgi:DNA processing protein
MLWRVSWGDALPGGWRCSLQAWGRPRPRWPAARGRVGTGSGGCGGCSGPLAQGWAGQAWPPLSGTLGAWPPPGGPPWRPSRPWWGWRPIGGSGSSAFAPAGVRSRWSAGRRRWRPARRCCSPVIPLPRRPCSELARPPLGLHWRGRGGLWPLLARRQAVAVVGTRRPSRAGLAMAEAHRAGPGPGRLAGGEWPGRWHRRRQPSGLPQPGGAAGGRARHPLARVYPSHHGRSSGRWGSRVC